MKLSERLRAETSSLHRQTEASPFIEQLLKGQVSLMAYAHLLSNLHTIYFALEQQLESHAGDAAISAIFDRALLRARPLQLDLEDIAGDAWRLLPIEPSALQFAAHLQEIGDREPQGLIAHAYVRYLGDLSGGQVICRAVAPMLGGNHAKAIRFYQFGDPLEVRELKRRFRETLDRLEVDQDHLVAEACTAFSLHQALFDQLARRFPNSAPAARLNETEL